MGFNAMQPGKVKRGDLLYLLAAVIVIVGMIVWAVR
jgi:hypothetical protein